MFNFAIIASKNQQQKEIRYKHLHIYGIHIYICNFSIWSPGGLRGAWCYRVPGRACSPPKPTTPFSPSPSPVWFSTRWGRPTSASWWMFTVSHMPLISLQTHFLLPEGWSHRAEMHLCLTPLSVSAAPVGPILLVEPQPTTVDVDSDVTLNCKWAGNPPLTLTWFKKGSNMVRDSS